MFGGDDMRYHYDRPTNWTQNYGTVHKCNHPLYNSCTLFKIDNKGLAVIQERFNHEHKSVYWTEIDAWLNDLIYLSKDFKKYFDKYADVEVNGLYPTVTVRQIMWKLKIKPLPKAYWTVYFDHSPL